MIDKFQLKIRKRKGKWIARVEYVDQFGQCRGAREASVRPEAATERSK